MTGQPSIHAGCVVIRETGLLIRGRSGAGKSRLAIALLDRAAALGWFGRLVADDRVLLTMANGRLVASPPDAIAGLIERRGFGLVAIRHLRDAVVTLVVDIEDAPPRLPEPRERALIAGASIPRIGVLRGDAEAASAVIAYLPTIP